MVDVQGIQGDYMVRATAADGNVRAFAATTRGMVEEARVLQGLSKTATAALGRTLSAGAMMGRMMKGDNDKLTIIISGKGPLGVVTVTAKANGDVKGCVGNPLAEVEPTPAGKLNVGGAVGRGSMQVISDMGLKEPYIGTVPLQTGEIAEDLAYYYAFSEQVPSAVALGVLLNHDCSVKEAGGFIVQMMPGATEENISMLEQRLGQLPTITELLEQGLSPEDILQRVFEGMGLEITETAPVQFKCDCSRERTEKALIALGAEGLQEMIDRNEPAEAHCEFCGKDYKFTPDELAQLLQEAQA